MAVNNDSEIFNPFISFGDSDDDLITVDEGNQEEKVEKPEKVTLEKEEKVEEPKKTSKGKVVKEEQEDLIDIDEESTSNELKKDTSKNSTLSISPYAQLLQEKGILPSINVEEFSKLGEEEQVEALLKAQEDEVDNRIENFIEGLPDKLRNALDLHFKGVDIEKIFKAESNKMQYESINEEELLKDEPLMKKLIIEDKVRLGMSREDAEDEVNDLVSLDKFAVKSLKNLKTSESKRLEQEALAEKQQNDNFIKAFNDKLENTDEFIKGLPLTKNVKNQVKDVLFKPIGKDKSGKPIYDMLEERAKDPQGFDLKIAQLYVLTNKFKDITLIQNKATTNATKNLVEQLKSQGKDSTGTPISYSEKKTGKEDNELLKALGIKR